MTVVRDLLRTFADREATDPESFPAKNIADLQRARVIGGPFPAALGGLGWSLPDAVRAIEEIATASPSTALIASMPVGLAGVYALGAEAAPEKYRESWCAQVEEVAGGYRAGQIYAACNSEKGAGGSLAATKTVARRDGDTWRLNGEKILASAGKHAHVFFSTAKVDPADLPGAGIVEFFFVRTDARGVEIIEDWDGFGMRSTESQTVRYHDAPATALMGFPSFLSHVQPLQYWHTLFAAIPLGCAAGILAELGTPAPQGPALKLRYAEALMRYESMKAYLLETAAAFRPGAGAAYAARVLRTKTYVTQESTKLCAELFALSGGSRYRRSGSMARMLADSFAGTALRPPLPLALETLAQDFSRGELDVRDGGG